MVVCLKVRQAFKGDHFVERAFLSRLHLSDGEDVSGQGELRIAIDF